MRLFAAVVTAALLFASGALAQSGSGMPAKPAPSVSTQKAGAGTAPVGHRQPTAAAVGNISNDPISAEDKELDRKIKNICKGC